MSYESKAHEYQVVFEFPGDDLDDFDRVIALEAMLEEELVSGEIDGHDAGEGVVNIFIFTREPRRCFEEVMQIMTGSKPRPSAAGYRDVEAESYVRLLPENDSSPFELK
jgi:hypothetical protein